ncbi:MAG: THUMP domain-containing protein [Deltaproteobacteria bacterium]|nr:THUMP domain-containing protein [Deltaproteobacteria bacterium]
MKGGRHFFATCAKGAEGLLRDELLALGLRGVKGERGGARFTLTLEDGLRATLRTRIAERVLLEIGRGPAGSAEELYESARAIEWEEEMTVKRTFAVRATGRAPGLDHSRFIALKVKDAIVDRFRDREGQRPSVETRHPDLQIAVHLRQEEATFFLDVAGVPLHRRGWRREKGEAPLKETLAAALLAWDGLDAERPLVDPLCGSGTIVIEAAQILSGRPPGVGRPFSATRWVSSGRTAQSVLDRMLAEVEKQAPPDLPRIIGRDHDGKVLEVARRNAERAGVLPLIDFQRADARRLGDLPADARLVTNPPYGQRLGKARLQLEGFVRTFGEAWAAASDPPPPLTVMAGMHGFAKHFGARAHRRHTLFNGPLECLLLHFGPPALRARPGAEEA